VEIGEERKPSGRGGKAIIQSFQEGRKEGPVEKGIAREAGGKEEEREVCSWAISGGGCALWEKKGDWDRRQNYDGKKKKTPRGKKKGPDILIMGSIAPKTKGKKGQETYHLEGRKDIEREKGRLKTTLSPQRELKSSLVGKERESPHLCFDKTNKKKGAVEGEKRRASL